MPAIKITSSLPMPMEQKQELAKEISALAAKIMGKPERYVQVVISDNDVIAFGGNFDAPSIFAAVLAIGGPTPEVCKKLSAAFCDVFSSYGIPPERTFINFSEHKGENWGFNGGTIG